MTWQPQLKTLLFHWHALLQLCHSDAACGDNQDYRHRPRCCPGRIEFGETLGKVPVLAKDNAGFIVNFLLTPYLMDAIRAVGEGVASIEHTDSAMKLGCKHPTGPLMLADFIGLDILIKGATTMFEDYKEKRYAPPPILKKMVVMGYLGAKSGKGFYDWADPKKPVLSSLDL